MPARVDADWAGWDVQRMFDALGGDPSSNRTANSINLVVPNVPVFSVSRAPRFAESWVEVDHTADPAALPILNLCADPDYDVEVSAVDGLDTGLAPAAKFGIIQGLSVPVANANQTPSTGLSIFDVVPTLGCLETTAALLAPLGGSLWPNYNRMGRQPQPIRVLAGTSLWLYDQNLGGRIAMSWHMRRIGVRL